MENQVEIPCCAASRPQSDAVEAAGDKSIPKEITGSADGMVLLSGGEFLMGTDDDIGYPSDGEGPVRPVFVDPFYIDSSGVSNQQFEQFVSATNYKTEAELFGWSFVFHLLVPPKVTPTVNQAVAEVPWWWQVKGAYWRRPEGPGTNLKKRWDHPVVHISWKDATAYCKWSGKRLLTEAEWEYAARGGLEQKRYVWGDELTPGGKHMCNIWQGNFPDDNLAEDGYAGTSPSMSYAPNGFGIYDVAGNVWEWTADWFSPNFHVDGPLKSPKGPPSGGSRVIRGGSYLCHESYCNRYRVAARSANTPDSSTGNMGFRCAMDVNP